MTESNGPHGLIVAAQDALGKATKAAGIAAVAAGIGAAALVVGIIAVGMATAAIITRVAGEMLSLLANLVTEMIEVVVAMVPGILRACITLISMIAVGLSFYLSLNAYAQDMAIWLAAIVATTIAVIPVAYAYSQRLWPMVLVQSGVVVAASWILLQAGALARTLAIVVMMGVIVFGQVMDDEGEM